MTLSASIHLAFRGMRRHFPSNVLYILLTVNMVYIATPMFASGKQIVLENSLSSLGISVSMLPDVRFSAEIQRMLTPSEREEFSALLPQSLIVTNDSHRYIWGFTVVYSYPDHPTASGFPWQHRINVSPGGAVDRNGLLAPNARYLVTPVSTVIASLGANGERSLGPSEQLDTAATVSSFEAQDAQLGKRLIVSIDSVIFEDGEIVGPDTAQRKVNINEKIRAEAELLNGLDGLTGGALRDRITTYASGEPTDAYSRHLVAIAQAFQSNLDRSGEGKLMELMSKMKNLRWFGSETYVQGRIK